MKKEDTELIALIFNHVGTFVSGSEQSETRKTITHVALVIERQMKAHDTNFLRSLNSLELTYSRSPHRLLTHLCSIYHFDSVGLTTNQLSHPWSWQTHVSEKCCEMALVVGKACYCKVTSADNDPD